MEALSTFLKAKKQNGDNGWKNTTTRLIMPLSMLSLNIRYHMNTTICYTIRGTNDRLWIRRMRTRIPGMAIPLDRLSICLRWNRIYPNSSAPPDNILSELEDEQENIYADLRHSIEKTFKAQGGPSEGSSDRYECVMIDELYLKSSLLHITLTTQTFANFNNTERTGK